MRKRIFDIFNKLGQNKLKYWFLRNGFECQDETVLCKHWYVSQISCISLFMFSSWYFIVNDINPYPAFILNLLSYIMDILNHMTKYYKIKKKLTSPLENVIQEGKGARKFYINFVWAEIILMIILLICYLIARFYWLGEGAEIISSRIFNTFSVFFVIICGIGNIESVLENMYSLEINYKTLDN